MTEMLTDIDPAPAAETHRKWEPAAWVLLFVVLVGAIQWYIPYPLDDDTAYHFSVGQLIGRHGILHSLPWTPFSRQFDHYADKEFLFHLLFVPFNGLGLVTAARVVGVLGGSLILTALYFVLRAEKVPCPGVWALLPVASSAFLFRFAMVRPHLLSIALALVLIRAYARGRLRLLALASLIYPLAYVAFWQIPLILVVSVEAARILAGGRLRWKPAATVAAGIAVGVALHPNTVNLIGINWIHMADVLFRGSWGGKTDINLGREFTPYPLDGWVQYLSGAVLMTGAAGVLSWRMRRTDAVPLGFAIAAVIFALLTAKSGRFTEYFIPFSVAALALARPLPDRKHLVVALLGISLFYSVVAGTYPLEVMGDVGAREAYIDPLLAGEFARQIPVGAHVFTCGWDYTGSLMVHLPDRYFIVAQDPTLFYLKDPALYDLWYRLPQLAPPDAAEIIREKFNSGYAICRNDPGLANLFDALAADPRVEATVSESWVLFDLGKGR
jgi:hypothetical protein